jgi:beta-glucosidase
MKEQAKGQNHFHWGVSAAAYQSEGAWNEDGKSNSIWDEFTLKKNKIRNGDHGQQANDFYHRYEHDLGLMQSLQIPNFRFSISWSRILPQGVGVINPKGVDFYNRLIDQCLQKGITPWVTLYHWDLPQVLEAKGGWTHRDILQWFAYYVETCVKLFGDRVQNWIVLNEPLVFTGAGYLLGIHAPGRRGINSFLAAVHHAALCQAIGGRIIRAHQPHAHIGTSFSCSLVEPENNNERHVKAAQRVDAIVNRTFVEPLAGLGYPVQDCKLFRKLEPFIKFDDLQQLPFDMDFIGVQNYTREVISHSFFTPYLWARAIPANQRMVETTEMNWEVYPKSMYEMLKKFGSYQSFKEVIVTENGAAFPDQLVDHKVDDPKRIAYLRQNIAQMFKAKSEGIPVNGYFVWSFTDNFEWAEGYTPRFGLVYVDYKTQERIVKQSGFWYSQIIQKLKDI